MRKSKGSYIFRSLEIWSFVLGATFQLLRLRYQKEEDEEALVEQKKKVGEWVRRSLIILGPTFIKVGQLLSTRVDLFDKEIIDELSLLQDSCPRFSGQRARSIVESELGRPLEELFDTFDNTPIAAASLGQVHVATKGGEKYAVKVQRPGLKQLFEVDLRNLRVLAQVLDRCFPDSSGPSRNWVGVHDQSADLLFQEIDYKREGRNAERFKENFKDYPWVRSPGIVWDRTSSKVLTMEFMGGVKMADQAEMTRQGINKAVLAQRLAECYLTQLCRHGFFHCDMHPGNLACDASAGGSIIYYDFGMMDEIQDNVRRGLVDLVFGLYEGDEKEVLDALRTMGVLRQKNIDRIGVERVVRYFVKEFRSTLTLPTPEVTDMSSEDIKKIIRQRRADLGAELLAVEKDFPLVFPPAFAFVYRSFASLDGVGKGLSSKYDLTKYAQPYLKELIDLRDGSVTLTAVKTFAKQLGWRPEDLKAVVTGPRKLAYIDDTLRQLEQGDLKLRVRVLEAEQALEKAQVTQSTTLAAVLTSMLLQLAEGASGGGLISLRSLYSVLATFCAFKVPVGIFKLYWLNKQSSEYGLKT